MLWLKWLTWTNYIVLFFDIDKTIHPNSVNLQKKKLLVSGKILTVLLRGDISPFTKLNTVISKKYEIRMSQNSNLLLFLTCFISYVKYSWFPQLYRVGCWHTPSANERRLSLNVTKKSQCVFFHPTLEDICLNRFWSDLGIEAQKKVGEKKNVSYAI